jgi:hypothetical protein
MKAKKCLSYTQITKKIITDNFVPTRGYTLEEIRDKLRLSKKLSDKVLIDTLSKYCNINKAGRNHFLAIKPDNTFIDCVRYRIILQSKEMGNHYHSCNAICKMLYEKRITDLLPSNEYDLYKFFTKAARKEADEIISERNIRRYISDVIYRLERKDGDSIDKVHVIWSSGETRPANIDELRTINSVLESFGKRGSAKDYPLLKKEIEAHLSLSEDEAYGGVVYGFHLAAPTISISDDAVSQKIRLHLYNDFKKKYESNLQCSPITKEIINKWGRYQLGLGYDFSYAKNRCGDE